MDKAGTARKGSWGLVGAALAVLAGDLCVQVWPRLPPAWLLAVPAVTGLVLVWRLPRWRWLGICLLAVAWTAWRADMALQQRLPAALEGEDIEVAGQVTGLPSAGVEAAHFMLRIDHATLDGKPLSLHGQARLAWYGHAHDRRVRACSRWRLRVRLRRPRALMDPGAFDSERQALERGLVAIGYVRDEGPNRLQGRPGFCLDGMREALSSRIASTLGSPSQAALLQALAVGDRRGLGQDVWRVARATGVSHLLAISGFHIGVAALAGVLLVRLLWWLWPGLGLRCPRQRAAAWAGLATAFPYAALAGFGLPVVRAMLMIATVALARGSRRKVSGAESLALALLVVWVFDPLAVLSAGFWLSYVGVALLMFALGGASSSRGGYLHRLGKAQALMTVALAPLAVGFFGQLSLVGALANLIAVPVVSLLVVPLTLAGTVLLAVSPILAHWVLCAAGGLMHALWWLLQRMAVWPAAHLYLPLAPWWTIPLAMLGVLWLWLPRGMPARWLGPLLCLPLLVPATHALHPGGFRVAVLDVGQGLSVVVRTKHHVLVFDTGARYPSGFNMGDAVVIPALRAWGLRHVDLLVVSHGDNDHAGGAPALMQVFPAPQRFSGEPARVRLGTQACYQGQHWQWDGVSLRMLHPQPGDIPLRHNDDSCVLLVSGSGGRLLITGDITSAVEPEVARAAGIGMPLVLVVPHHGSKTSSSAGFIEQLHPRLAVVSAGWHNRYGHPSASVVARYRTAGVPLLNTATSGAVLLAFPASGPPHVAARWRLRQRRYWRE